MSTGLRIGIDIGGTKTAAVLLAPSGEVLAERETATEPGATAVLASAGRAVDELVQAAAADRSAVRGIGVGVPGQVRHGSGEVLHAYNIGVDRLALAPLLSKHTGIPVALENDVNAAALGAAHLLQLTGTIAYLNLGTGLASGLVIDGALQRGANGVTGELGHLAIDPLGRPCPCGQRGCLETVASGSALTTFWPAGGPHPGRTLLPAVDADDPAAIDAFEQLARGTASAIRVLTMLLDPTAVVIGGGLRLLGPRLFAEIADTLDRWASASPFLAEMQMSSRIAVLPEGSPAAAVGAALIQPGRI